MLRLGMALSYVCVLVFEVMIGRNEGFIKDTLFMIYDAVCKWLYFCGFFLSM